MAFICIGLKRPENILVLELFVNPFKFIAILIPIFLDKFINSSSIISFENKDNSYIHSASSNKNDIIEKILNYSFNTRSKNICCIVISNNIVIYNINDNSGAHRINNSLYNNKIKSLIKTVEKYIEIKYKSKKQQT